MSFWTDSQIVRLEQLWCRGQSASQIGSELGCSRSAVISKLHRLKLGARSVGFEVNAAARRKIREAIEKRKHERRDPRDIARKPDRAPVTRWHSGGQVLSVAALNAMEREPTKRQLRDVLAEAVRNTAILQEVGA